MLYHIKDDDDDGRQSELKFSPNDKKLITRCFAYLFEDNRSNNIKGDLHTCFKFTRSILAGSSLCRRAFSSKKNKSWEKL